MAIQDGRLLRGIILFMQVYIQYIKIDTSTVYLPNFSGHGQDGEVSHNSPVHPLIIGLIHSRDTCCYLHRMWEKVPVSTKTH